MISIDESKLNFTDRLGLAYCRLNRCEWDEIFGPKPDGFDALPDFPPKKRLFRKKRPSKHDYVFPAIMTIESIIGRANTSRCWWLFALGKTEAEWLHWFAVKTLEEGLSSILH